MARALLLACSLLVSAVSAGGLGADSAPASAPPDPVVAAAGDIACDPASASYNGGVGTATECRAKYTSDLLVDGGLAAVLPLGDLQYADATLAKFQQSYDPTWGRVKALTRPAPGNHEYATAGAAGYFDYFNGVGSFGGAAGDRDRGYYSYEVGTWHMIALNSNCPYVGGCDEGSPQDEWLEADLAAHPGSCILAYTHHPRFSSGPHGGTTAMEPVWQDLYAAGADVFLSGHDHLYERFARQSPSGVADPLGIRQFVVGTGGKTHYPVVAVAPNSEARDSESYGVLELTLESDGYEWRFVSEAGVITDAGTDVCEPDIPESTPPVITDPAPPEPVPSVPVPADPVVPVPVPSDPVVSDPIDGGAAASHLANPPAEPPETKITGGPRGKTRDRTPTFRFGSTDDAAAFRCKRDGKPWEPCASPVRLPRLSFGRQAFKVISIDAAGNQDPEFARRRFTVVR